MNLLNVGIFERLAENSVVLYMLQNRRMFIKHTYAKAI
ncbi:MAG: hypothetical protein SCARUB_01561 [Candidatus Scalindua rubra]|uniref:Uncharacterized protein n=1 Tax=Candidatus Scalindua rubra TaxID=1872076 RepID=A0A1E3XCD3_9BACT|nr:MAG: hypothetical protein SCARUB_01561 [Candidatus Scalindua rubra]